ncbi:MAG: hypothetical protein JWM14_1083 [Chitinophagaceae bacterium]|nr:hypothetical protein [Chitinophagaceae bacterium]
MKKLKLEELEVKSLMTSLQDQSADEVKGGTGTTVTPTIGVSIMSIVVTVVVASIAISGGSY